MTLKNSSFNPASKDWKLVDHDPVTSISTYQKLEGDTLIVRQYYEAAPQLFEQNAKLRNETSGKRWGDGQIVASIPLPELFSDNTYVGRAFKQGDMQSVKKFLNDPDNIRYRLKEGNL